MDSLAHPFFFEWTFWARISAAVVCGGVIGLERQFHHKPAGLRTCVLICLGSTVFAMLPDMIARQTSAAFDPTRIAGQVITGVGFLGAGAIIHHGFSVAGLTSAATIWMVSGIGLVIGVGYPLTAGAITACTILTLILLGWLERRWLDR
jgi:putative Mg2+ transporter-C (MgtC) family protein